MTEVTEKQRKEFPITVTKSELADALNISSSAVQELLNRKYFDDLVKLGYKANDKIINRAILLFLKDTICLLPEDFSR